MKALFLFCTVLATTVTCTVNAQAPGTLDNTFGTGGITMNGPYATVTDDDGKAVAIQSDGKIVVAGMTDAGGASGYDFGICRYNANGTLDNTFSGDGKETTVVSAGLDLVAGIDIQPDGKIVVCGTANLNQFAVVRYNTNGSLDNSFGTGGMVVMNVSPGSEGATSVKVQPDGKILVAGYATLSGTDDFALVRFNTNGTLDNTFGTVGIVTTAIGNAGESVSALALQPDGKIIAAGHMNNISAPRRFVVARYTTTGVLDASFGASGTATAAPTTGHNYAFAVGLQPDGKIVLGGRSYNTANYDFSIVRFDATGLLDNTFGTGGTAVTPVGAADMGAALVIQANGKIVVAGYANNGSNTDFALVRYLPGGTLDNAFGTNGIVTHSVGAGMDEIRAASLQTDGKLVIAGTVLNGGNSIDFAVARYHLDCQVVSAPASIAGNSLVCPGSNTYSVAPVSGAIAYSWSLPVGWSGSSTSHMITVNVSASSSGTLQAAAVGSCNTSSFTTLPVTVSSCVGIEENVQDEFGFGLYPNPANGYFTIETEQPGTYHYTIINSLGALVSTGEFDSSTRLNLTGCVAGYYQVTITNSNNVPCGRKSLFLVE